MNDKYKRALEALEDNEDDEIEEEYLVERRSSAKRSAKVQVRFIYCF